MTETAETVGRDLIDDLIDALNDGVDSVTFDRDVLDTDRPEDWGAVELSGEDGGEWADGVMIDQALNADIWVSVSDRGSAVKRQVQAVLKAFCAGIVGGWRFVRRAWLYDIEKVMWHWTISIDGPLAESAVSSGTEAAEPTEAQPVQQDDETAEPTDTQGE